MKTTRKLTRRSFMARVAGGAVVGGAAMTLIGGRAEAVQATDSDTGANADAAGRGRTGTTDNDTGSNADRAGRGRSARARACTDNDRGNNSDPAGRGRGTGVTDNDSGANSDPARCGRGR